MADDGLAEDKITWYSNQEGGLPVWKKIKLHGTQTSHDHMRVA